MLQKPSAVPSPIVGHQNNINSRQQAQQNADDDILLAFSVLGLTGTQDAGAVPIEETTGGGTKRGGLGVGARESSTGKRAGGWLSSLNTVVAGGDRQERQPEIVLMLMLSANQEPSVRNSRPASPTRRLASSASTRSPPLATTRSISNGSITIYQSEQRSWDQSPGFPSSNAASSIPAGMGMRASSDEGGDLDTGRRPGSLGQEGIVHFSVPAKISRDWGEGFWRVEDEGGDGGGGVAATFTAELWQVVNRARRVLLGSLRVSWAELSAIPPDPRQCGNCGLFQSERYPSAFLVAWKLPTNNPPRPLSLSSSGAANPVVEPFNPMTTYFTSLRRVVEPVKFPKDVYAGGILNGGLLRGWDRSAGDSGSGSGAVDHLDVGFAALSTSTSSATASSATDGLELVVCQELAVETKFAYKLPLQFMFPVYNALRTSAAAWELRAREERLRQGLFESDEEAFSHGRVLVRVSVSRARGLSRFAAASAAAASAGGGGPVTISTPKEEQNGGDPLAFPAGIGGAAGSAGTLEPSPAGGGIDGNNKMSASMRRLGGRMRGMGVKAVAMAKIASQANYFVKVVYQPPGAEASFTASTPPLTDPIATIGNSNSIKTAPERVVGVTNTEYGNVEPVWGTNANRNACPYNQPRLQHQVSGSTRLDVRGESTDIYDGVGGFPTEESFYVSGMRHDSSSAAAGLAFNFYISKEDLEEASGTGSVRLFLYQNTFSLKAGIVDVPVGFVTIPLSPDSQNSTLRAPEWWDVQGYTSANAQAGAGDSCTSQVAAAGAVEGFEGALSATPQILVGVSVQARSSSLARPESPQRRSLPLSASSTLGGGPSSYGGMFGIDGGVGANTTGSHLLGGTVGRGGAAGGRDPEPGDWMKVDDDSDSENEGLDETAAAAAIASSSSDGVMRTGTSMSAVSLDAAVDKGPGLGSFDASTILSCYEWMHLIGGANASSSLDTETLAALFYQVEYPLGWIEGHCRKVSGQCDWLARMLDLYSQRLAEGVNFRSSLLKEDPLLQYIATNLHIQVWSVRDPATGKDTCYDFVTTGAPAAHVLGHNEGGLVTLQASLRGLGSRVMGLRAKCRECCLKGGLEKITELEGHVDRLRDALLEYEVLSGAVSMRRACVLSQAISIAAASFCTKLEMMARGTLDVASDLSTGGCESVDDLAKRWTTAGFLLGVEGLLSIHGKEHGMVEDTVAALDMLSDFKLKVLPATPDEPLRNGREHSVERSEDDAGERDGDFELEVGVEGKTIQCLVGRRSLEKLPRVLWDREGGGLVHIVPVLFTQGIDIQQSMSHASSSSREKTAFQADINSHNLARLNRYCHRVCPAKRAGAAGASGPTRNWSAGTPPSVQQQQQRRHETGDDGDGTSGLSGSGRRVVSPSAAPPMPALPRKKLASGDANATKDVLGMGDFGVSFNSTVSTSRRADGATALPSMPALSQNRLSALWLENPVARDNFISDQNSPRTVPEWTHPALSELETAVRDDKANHKNTAILLEAQVAVRRLCGGRVTFCKSGKDRTAMSVTLEEALLLAAKTKDSANGVGGGWRTADRNGALRDANVLRAHGARLLVAEKNIGRPLYSFNALQRQFIPELYQPPVQTIQDVITSALNRDS